MHTGCLTDPHYQANNKQSIPLAREFSTTCTAHNDHQDTSYTTIPMSKLFQMSEVKDRHGETRHDCSCTYKDTVVPLPLIVYGCTKVSLSYFYALTPLDVPLVAFVATEESIWQVKYATDASSGHEKWKLLEGQALEIPGATALDVDVMENKIYWINLNDKVGTIYGDYV